MKQSIPRTAHELAHLSFIARALQTCADELSYSSSQGKHVHLMQLLIAHHGETCTAHAGHIAHPGQIRADEISPIAQALKMCADELHPIAQAGKPCAAHVAHIAHQWAALEKS